MLRAFVYVSQRDMRHPVSISWTRPLGSTGTLPLPLVVVVVVVVEVVVRRGVQESRTLSINMFMEVGNLDIVKTYETGFNQGF